MANMVMAYIVMACIVMPALEHATCNMRHTPCDSTNVGTQAHTLMHGITRSQAFLHELSCAHAHVYTHAYAHTRTLVCTCTFLYTCLRAHDSTVRQRQAAYQAAEL